MLPKVATHILHQTSRAAAAIQSQSGHTIRNVLQLQSSSGPTTSTGSLGGWNGAGSSSWGSNGTGPGGAKFNAGSRFYNGYTGAGRAVTQANSSTSHDGTSGQNDEADDFNVKRVSLHHGHKPRLRSHSLSIVSGRHDREEKLGVLKTVQLHVASRHGFASSPCLDNSGEVADGLYAPSSTNKPRSVLVRRNSTHTSSPIDSPPPPPPQPPPPLAHSLTDPSAPQTTAPPPAPEEDRLVETLTFRSLKAARDSKDPARALKEVLHFRSTALNPTVMEFNMALEALHETRQRGDPLTILLETYNDMVKRSIYPNIKTYLVLILALTDRDHEVQRVITSLEARNKRRELAGRIEAVQQATDEQRVTQLRAEKNLASAMALFDAAISLNGHRKIPMSIYINLIKSCSVHSNIDGAIHVFAHLERRPDLLPTAAIFTHLISVYTNTGDLQGAKEVFEEFKSAAKSGRMAWTLSAAMNPPATEVASERHALARNSQLSVWNKMMESHFRCNDASGALGLLEQMMDSNVDTFTPSAPPPPASSTFSLIIGGFCQAGDVKTALLWFDRLLAQGDVARHPYEPTTTPSRPDQIAWMIMLENLAHAGMIEDLNRIWSIFRATASQEGLAVRATDRLMVFNANIKYLESKSELDKGTALKTARFLEEQVLQEDTSVSPIRLTENGVRNMVEKLAEQYANIGAVQKAIDIVERQVAAEMADIQQAEHSGEFTDDRVHWKLKQIRHLVMSVTPSVLQQQHGSSASTLSTTLQIARLSDSVGLLPHRPLAPYYIHSYGEAKTRGEKLILSYRDWDLLLFASTTMDLPLNDEDVREAPKLENYSFQGTASLLEDMHQFGIPLDQLNPATIRRVVRSLYTKLDANEIQALFAKLGPDYGRLLNNPRRDLQSFRAEGKKIKNLSGITLSKGSNIKIDAAHSRLVDEHGVPNPKITPIIAYSRFEAGLRKNTYPTPATLGRLINSLGRLGELDKVRKLYETAQIVLSSLDDQKQWQSQGWYQVEDSMIIAFAHAGDIDAAHVHRVRILEQGGSPSADAYGALIHSVKDTTDDTSNAMALFKESQMQSVTPSVYLYNTIISKLAKARKADFALELFQQMKANNFRPSSITFGAVIAACARVGDTYSAEMLFNEMTSQPNFRPRIPPYNTMMQMYTSTKPDRERALHYYNALLHARIQPSAHTYKLLMDAYGTIEPVDVAAMEEVFLRLQKDERIQVQGSHWASLIHVHGCVNKNLDKAIEIFESIATHSSTSMSSTPLPDAVTYESLINVLVTHRRTDLIPHYIHRLQASNIHMTAYIVNFMIKGYAAVGDLEEARTLFEGLEDPPQGVAASNNHVPHEGAPSAHVPHASPVYREPSTWEAMVRSELGNGHRDRALALLQRLQARQFPPAVYNRISGIMLDDSVSPWASDPSSPSSFDRSSYSS